MKETIDYMKFAIEHQKEFGYEIYKNYGNGVINIKCLKCGAIKTINVKSIYKNIKEKTKKEYLFHNQYCASYFLDLCIHKVGEKAGNHFYDFFRHSKERCCNPNNKDYERYKGKFKFDDFPDFYHGCFDAYLEGLSKWDYKELTIDRINGTKGYEKGNIRFVDMTTNLRNKPYVKPVKMTNLFTKEVITANSIGELAVKFGNIKYAPNIHKCLVEERDYGNIYKIEYI